MTYKAFSEKIIYYTLIYTQLIPISLLKWKLYEGRKFAICSSLKKKKTETY